MTTILLTALGGFLLSLTTQVLLWWMIRVRREILILGLVYLVIPGLAYLGAAVTGMAPGAHLLMAALLHLSLSAAFIQTYPALREDIPSVSLLFLIRDNPGLRENELIDLMTGDERLLSQKMADLDSDGLITGHGDDAHLTRTGALLATVFHHYRKLLGTKRDQG